MAKYAAAATRRMAKQPTEGPNAAKPAQKGLPSGLLGYMAKKKQGGADPTEPDSDDAAPVSKPNGPGGAKPNAKAPVGQGGQGDSQDNSNTGTEGFGGDRGRKSTPLNSSHQIITHPVFCFQ